MRFTVVWHSEAEEGLADIWMNATDRLAVTQASARIQLLLAADPETHGEEFYGDRLLTVSPLSVTYTVSRDDRLVRVLQVWCHQP